MNTAATPGTRLTAYSLGNNGFVSTRILSALGAEPHIRQAGVTIFATSKAHAVRLYKSHQCGHTTVGSVNVSENNVATALRNAGYGTAPSVFVMNLDNHSNSPIVSVDDQGAPTVVARLTYRAGGGFDFVATQTAPLQDAMTRQSPKPLSNLSLHATNRPASFYPHLHEKGLLLLDPPYQRGAVWSTAQQMGLIYSWLRGLPIPAVVINKRDTTAWDRANPGYDGPMWAVIDGQQRIRTAIAWFNSDLAVPSSWFKPDLVDTSENTDDGLYVRFAGLALPGQRHFDNFALLPTAEAQLPTVEAEAEVYLLVNGGGTPQTAADMARAGRVAAGSPA